MKKLPNVEKCMGITPILLFLLNSSIKKIGSIKKKNFPHSPGNSDSVVISSFSRVSQLHFF
jgi:hypothetical protein